MLLVSCFERNREYRESDYSEFGTFVDSLDVDLTGQWFDRMGVSGDADSLLSYLRHELTRNGLDTTAFYIPQIAEDLGIVRQLAFDSLGVNINEVLARLDDNLTEAFVSYATGQRYGFVRPSKLFNRLDMKADSSGYARLFDYEYIPNQDIKIDRTGEGGIGRQTRIPRGIAAAELRLPRPAG